MAIVLLSLSNEVFLVLLLPLYCLKILFLAYGKPHGYVTFSMDSVILFSGTPMLAFKLFLWRVVAEALVQTAEHSGSLGEGRLSRLLGLPRSGSFLTHMGACSWTAWLHPQGSRWPGHQKHCVKSLARLHGSVP